MGRKNVNFKKLLSAVLLVCFMATSSFAQEAPAEATATTKSGPRKQLSIIFLSGLSGAVLGLSTLSFYGRPQDHMSNIAVGFAIGVVFGTVYVTYNTAKKPKEYLSEVETNPFKPIETSRGVVEARKSPQLFSYNFSF
jgi:hypothetical protein